VSYIKNTCYKVKTPTGWQNFDGIKKTAKKGLISILFVSGKRIICTQEHRFLDLNNQLIYARDLTFGTCLSSDVVENFKFLEALEEEVYDLINVSNGHLYYTNDIVSSNCAFIRDFDDIWTSLYPTLSTGGNAIILSTPNGVGGQYYKLWIEAESKANDFNPTRLLWWVHPEHDQAWFDKETKNLARRNIAQEFLCDFISSGDTFLQPGDLERLRDKISVPIERSGPHLNVWTWAKPEEGKKYILSADVSRGDAADFSTFHILDYDTCEVAAEFMGKIPPDKFADLLVEYGKLYNEALICPEQNTFGYFTCIKLRDLGYPRLYYHSARGDIFEYKPASPDEVPGFSTQAKSRNQILTKLEEFIRNGQLTSFSQRLYDQFQAFVWNGSKASAAKDAHDDLIISLAIGCWLASGAGAPNDKSMTMAYAMLKATQRGNRTFDELPGGINDVKPVFNQHMRGFTPQQLSKPRDASDVRGIDLTDFSWLYK